MDFIRLFFNSMVDFIKNNPIFCITVLMLALLAPSVLTGIASVILFLGLGFILLMLFVVLMLRWRFNRVHERMQEQFRQQQEQNPHNPYNREQFRREKMHDQGEVKVYRTSETPEKRVSDRVGDYVDFEETPNK